MWVRAIEYPFGSKVRYVRWVKTKHPSSYAYKRNRDWNPWRGRQTLTQVRIKNVRWHRIYCGARCATYPPIVI